MSVTVRLIAAALLGCAGVWIVVSAFVQPTPPLGRMLQHLARSGTAASSGVRRQWWRSPLGHVRFAPSTLADLRLVRRPPEVHAAMLVGGAVIGLFVPVLAVVVGQIVGVVDRSALMPMAGALFGAVVVPLAVHAAARTRAVAVRRDLRYQLSAYLDVVTMLLAGNVGNEGALRQAALAGDGRLFGELRQRILAAETANKSLVSALAALGDDLELTELQQIAASAALGSAAGAPVARSLTAKCATLRAALAAEQEAEARVRTTKITVPLVGMSLLIMTAVMYPALQL